MTDPRELEECNLSLYPLTQEEKALRFTEYAGCYDQIEFERYMVGRRKVLYLTEQLRRAEG